jgi:hypothetical protein
MRTENLTAILAANLEPVDPKRTMWRHVFGITAGALAPLILSGGILHVNPALPHEVSLPAFWTTCAVCPFLIALVCAPLFLSFLWFLKDLAPTQLNSAGAGGSREVHR